MPSPQLPRLVAALARNARPPGTPVAVLREDFDSYADRAVLPEDVTLEPAHPAAGNGERTVPSGEWAVPSGAPLGRAILHLHGGGYVLGSPRTHRSIATWLARATGTRVLTVDYRLGPEHPHPAAVHDAVAAYRWLIEDEGLDPASIAISGDSAGGGLTVATLVALRDAGSELPAAAVCISPWSDLSLPGGTFQANAARDPQVSRGGLADMAGWYLGGADPRAPLASPRYADLSGLPPILIHVGSAEQLLDDARELAAAAQAAGVEITLEVHQDMIHVWHAFAPKLPEAMDGIQRIAEWLHDRLH